MPKVEASASGPIDLTPVATRLVNSVRYLISGKPPISWFGPGQPIQPAAQTEAVGREFDYPVTQNINYQPRSLEYISFDMLKSLASSYDLLRLMIETRKDQMVKLKWDIVVSDDAKAAGQRKLDPKIRQPLVALLRRPDGVHSWQQWLRVIMDQMLVLDAATIFPRRTLKGDIVRLDYIDGATINRLVNGEGRTPLPPDPAYQQVLHGLPAVNYTVNDLLYAPRNVRAEKLFGYSPVEQIIMTAQIGLKREMHQLAAYTDGNVPEAISYAPDTWTPDQITKFQKNFDSMLAGDLQKRRRVRFLPGGKGQFQMLHPSALFDQFDEWLIRIICFAFSITPTAFIKSVNRASSDSMKETALEEGLLPNMLWVTDTINFIIQNYMGIEEAAFEWLNDRDTDSKDQMTIDTGYVKAGVQTIDEVRDGLGMDPLPAGIGATPMVYTATGAIRLDTQVNPPEPPPAAPAGGSPATPGETPPSPGAKPGGPGGPIPDAKPPPTPKPGGQGGGKEGSEDSVGHTAGKAVRKKVALKPINRQREAAKQAHKQLKTLLAEALWKDGAAAAKLVGAKTAAAEKAGTKDTQALIDQVMADLQLSGIAGVVEKAQKIIESLAADGGVQALAQIGLEDDQALVADVHTRAVTWAQRHAAALVSGVADTTREQLRGTVTSALEDGLTGGDLARQIRGSFGFSADRADMIARTESAAADVQGNLEGYKASGVVSKKYWVLSDDHPDEDECNENEDQGAIDLDDAFSSGDDGPPAHPNCECDVIPVIEE